MLTPFVLFFGLTVATAVIAYWSDNLGKKLGKKRISLLGLRPRTTATVLTIASSWGIMLFTLVVLLVAARPLRNALFRYDSLRAQSDTLRAQSEDLRRENTRTQQELSKTESRLVTLEYTARQAADEARKQSLQAQISERAAKAAQQSEKRAREAEKRAKFGASQAQTREKQARLGEQNATRQALRAQKELGSSRLQLQQTDLALQNAQKRLEAAGIKVRLAQTDAEKAEKAARRARAGEKSARAGEKNATESARRAYDAARNAYRSAREAIEEQERARAQVDALLAQRADLQNRVDLLAAQAQILENDVQFFSNSATLLSTLPVLVSAGQTIAARNLPPDLTASRIEAHLQSLLKTARETTGPDLLPGATVRLWTPEISANTTADTTPRNNSSGDGTQPTNSPGGGPVGEAELISRAAEFIQQIGESSVRLVALRNFLEGETTIWARIVVVPVRPALRAGEVLATQAIDGRSGDAAIFKALLMLVENGRAEATKRGANPPQSPDDPNFYESGTNELIFSALRQIERANRTVTVRLVVADSVSSVEPVRARFEILRP